MGMSGISWMASTLSGIGEKIRVGMGEKVKIPPIDRNWDCNSFRTKYSWWVEWDLYMSRVGLIYEQSGIDLWVEWDLYK